MKKALLRLEDIQPYGSYGTDIGLAKLKAIGDYLRSENIPFQMSVIPRAIHKQINYDKSIADTEDAFINNFNSTIKYLQEEDNAYVGMHGYTHQYGDSESGLGVEFYTPFVTSDVPPKDKIEAYLDPELFKNSYAYQKMKMGYETFEKSGIKNNWGFSTPHYQAYFVQRSIIEAWSGLLYEVDPYDKEISRKAVIKDRKDPFYRGVIYVPTPLGYLKHTDPQADVDRILKELDSYTDNDLASFFQAPFIEFPFIEVTDNGVIYDDNSYLKQLVRGFKKKGFTFVSILDLIDFVPSAKAINIFGGESTKMFFSDINGDGADECIGWNTVTGELKYAKPNIEKFPDRLYEKITDFKDLGLNKQFKGEDWSLHFGDFNGDGKSDLLAWNTESRALRVAISDGKQFVFEDGFGDFSSIEKWGVYYSHRPLIGDFDGDGKDDLFMWNYDKGEGYVALSNGSKFEFDIKPWIKKEPADYTSIPFAGDFNGDGKTDILFWDIKKGAWSVAISTGEKFVFKSSDGNDSWLDEWAVGEAWHPIINDFNGDGIDDILVVQPIRGNWQLALGTGDGFELTGRPFKFWAGEINMEPYAADLNGDGKAALLARHPLVGNGSIDCAVSVLSSKR